jgi:hypothetical protein
MIPIFKIANFILDYEVNYTKIGGYDEKCHQIVRIFFLFYLWMYYTR